LNGIAVGQVFLFAFFAKPARERFFGFHPLCGGHGFRVQSENVELGAGQKSLLFSQSVL
jgi:hypothetical protein